jgi:hypothetical protein
MKNERCTMEGVRCVQRDVVIADPKPLTPPNRLDGLGRRQSRRVEPALELGARVGLDDIWWVDADVEAYEHARVEGL